MPAARVTFAVSLSLLLGLGAAAPCARAQQPAAAADTSPAPQAPEVIRPAPGGFDTCLVLSGGGARGMAHIGVIKVLERERIPVDCIVGTSMGAVIGSLYASGLSAEEIERQMRALDWGAMFVDRIDRSVMSQRRKAEDRSFLAKGGFGLRDGRLGLPPSLFEGQRLALSLRKALLPSAGIDDFDALPIPYRAIGTDLETGDAIAMREGDLVNAVRASMAVPGVFAPVSYGERSLIDGGISMNLPVQAAREWGARRIIAVDIAATLKNRDQLLDPFTIVDQMVTALMLKETRRQMALLDAGDVMIVPALGDLSSADFNAGLEQGVALGMEATEAALPKLRPMALSPEAYAQWRAARIARLRPLPETVSEVRLVNSASVDDDAILGYVGVEPGDPFEAETVERDLAKLYGLGQFSRAYYTLERNLQDQTVLTYVTRSRRWEEDGNLRFGLFLLDDFEGGAEYQLGARFTRRELNRFGGEWLAEARIGDSNRLLGEWHQPLRLQRDLFLRSALEWQGRNRWLIDDAGVAARYRVNHWDARLAFGAQLGASAELSLAAFARRNHFDARAGALAADLPRTRSSNGLELRAVLDTQDDAEFPSSGWYLDLRHARYLPALGSESTGFSSRADAHYAFGALGGRWLLGLHAQDRRGSAVETTATLGGPFRLSGYGVDALRGDGAALATLQYSYPLAQVLQYPVFFGGSLEGGQVWRQGQRPNWERFIAAGSLFGGVDTPLGPVYFGLGLAESGEETVFFRLGQPQ